MIASDTEADPLAVLAGMLAWSGCAIGPGTYVMQGRDRHPPKVWPMLVGATATGRKGTSESDGLSALSALSSLPRRRSGLSSGEGLIEAFLPSDGEDSLPDPRLLVTEGEWEGPLARSQQKGSSLSAVLRDAWDNRPLATMTVTGRQVDHHHLVVVAHITPDALRRGMGGMEVSNGFLNRFLITEVRRPHLVPWPSEIWSRPTSCWEPSSAVPSTPVPGSGRSPSKPRTSTSPGIGRPSTNGSRTPSGWRWRPPVGPATCSAWR